MASAVPEFLPVSGVVDAEGRLIEADPPLATLQIEAGADIGGMLALPQLAHLASLVRQLGAPMSRAITAAGAEQDLDLWVIAEPEGDRVHLRIERWAARPASGPRFPRLVESETGPSARTSNDWAVDAELRLTHLGADLADRLGTDVRWALGQPLTRVMRLIEEPDGSLPLLTALSQRIPFEKQQARPRDREDPNLLLSGQPLLLQDGTIAGFEGTAIGIESPGTASDQAALPFELPLDTVLRSPLDQIIGAADQIVDRSDGPLRRDYAAYATDIAAAARHLLGVIRGMEGPPALQSEDIDLAVLAEDTVAMLQPDATARGVAIDFTQVDASLPARGDSRAVIQILINLIANAVRHSPSGASVTLLSVIDLRSASLTIADQGPGIAVADQQRIFEKFEQVGASPGGTGLGLTIARRLAQAMNGDITVASAPGEGARFTLSLPRPPAES